MPTLVKIAPARIEAERLLGPTSDRLLHVAGVARSAERARGAVPTPDHELLITAAWLHDIGYAVEATATGFHPLDGARHLRLIGAPDRLCRLVAHHSGSDIEATARGLAGALHREFPREQSAVADALTYADMTTGPLGQELAVEDRLTEILQRYPENDVVHQSILRAAPEIVATVYRVEQQLQLV